MGSYLYKSGKGPLISILWIFSLLCCVLIFVLFYIGRKNFVPIDFSIVLWLTVMTLLAFALPACFLWLNGKYVTSITDLSDGNIELRLWNAWGKAKKMTYPKVVLDNKRLKFDSDIAGDPGLPSTPYYQLKTSDGKKYIIDMQGSFRDDFDY